MLSQQNVARQHQVVCAFYKFVQAPITRKHAFLYPRTYTNHLVIILIDFEI